MYNEKDDKGVVLFYAITPTLYPVIPTSPYILTLVYLIFVAAYLQALERENNPQKKFWDQLGFEPKTQDVMGTDTAFLLVKYVFVLVLE